MPHIPKTVAQCTEPDRPVWCMIRHWACCRPEKKDEKRRLKKSKSNSKEVFVYFYYMSFGKKGGKIKTDAKHTNLIKTKLLWIECSELNLNQQSYCRDMYLCAVCFAPCGKLNLIINQQSQRRNVSYHLADCHDIFHSSNHHLVAFHWVLQTPYIHTQNRLHACFSHGMCSVTINFAYQLFLTPWGRLDCWNGSEFLMVWM